MSGGRDWCPKCESGFVPDGGGGYTTCEHCWQRVPPGSVVLTPEQVAQVQKDAAFLWLAFQPRPGWRQDDVQGAYERILALLEPKP